jgi:hypothetical protein
VILNKKIEVVINPSNFSHFKKYYDNIKKGEKKIVNFDELTKGSHSMIKLKCDNCDKEKEMQYKNYINYGYKEGEWLCRMCKTKENNLKNFGVEWTTQREDVKSKTKEKCLIKYGFENPMQNEKIKEKAIKNRNFEKESITRKHKLIDEYGVDNISKCQHIKKKLSEKSYYKSEECRIKLENFSNKKRKEKFDNYVGYKKGKIELFCIKCNKNFHTTNSLYNHRKNSGLEICTICNSIGVQYSNSEKKLYEFIKDNYKGNIITSSRKIIDPYQLDIFIPELNIAFEYNGIYWHSSKFKDKNYHKMKSELCKEKDIFLFHIWEHKWKKEEYNEKIINILKNNLDTMHNSEVITETGSYEEWCCLKQGYSIVENRDPICENIQGNLVFNAGFKKLTKQNDIK